MKNYWNIIKEQYSLDYIENSSKSKIQILEKVFNSMDINVHTVAFLHYSPIIDLMAEEFDVYLESKEYSLSQNKKVKSFNINDRSIKFPIVLGIDDYLTYFSTELEQKSQLEKIKHICSDLFLTTLCDYKNSAPYKKKQIEVLQEFKNSNILLEHNISDQNDKQSWKNCFYFIEGQKNLTVIGPHQRRTMYFKQLAKYSSDIGCREYAIQKQVLYKGFAKQHWEHIITVRF
jgi:hypothetical protein